MNTKVTMDKLVALCKNRGFIFPGSEIYGGLANAWDYGPLGVEYKNNVKSGDITNMEGIAAQHYWKYLINPDFLRGRFGDSPNQFFNFGYSVLRSVVARAIVETGLLPVLGIFHKNKFNHITQAYRQPGSIFKTV